MNDNQYKTQIATIFAQIFVIFFAQKLYLPYNFFIWFIRTAQSINPIFFTDNFSVFRSNAAFSEK